MSQSVRELPSPLRADTEALKFFEGVVGLVEANSFEKHQLWALNRAKQDGIGVAPRVWVENLAGIGRCIGYVVDMPVFVSLMTATIDGQKILFYEATSQVVDHRMVEAWLQYNMPTTALRPDTPYLNKTDANNFHTIFR